MVAINLDDVTDFLVSKGMYNCDLNGFMRDCREDGCSALLAAKVRSYVCNVSVGDMLLIPHGVVVAEEAVGDSDSCGVKFRFLPFNDSEYVNVGRCFLHTIASST